LTIVLRKLKNKKMKQLDLTEAQKKTLLEIYNSFQNCNDKDIKKQIVYEYLANFIELAQQGITIEHIPEILNN